MQTYWNQNQNQWFPGVFRPQWVISPTPLQIKKNASLRPAFKKRCCCRCSLFLARTLNGNQFLEAKLFDVNTQSGNTYTGLSIIRYITLLNTGLPRYISLLNTGLSRYISLLNTGLPRYISILNTGLPRYISFLNTGLRRYITLFNTGLPWYIFFLIQGYLDILPF